MLTALWQVELPEARNPFTDVPPYHYFGDNEVVHWRSTWRDPDATAIAFRSGPPAGHHIADLYATYPEWRPGLGHAHPDAGSFLLASKGVFTEAYNERFRMSEVRRDLVVVDGRFLMILDQLTSEDPHVYDWYLHSDQPAVQTGDHAWEMVNGPARLRVHSFSDIEKAQIAPTVVETQLYPGKLARPQQRGYHINLRSPPRATFTFLTAMGIQSSDVTADSFSATQRSSRCLEFVDGNDACRIWIGDHPGVLDGPFAFVLTSDQVVKALGFSGTRFVTDEGSFASSTPGTFCLYPADDGSWTSDGPTLDLVIERPGIPDS